MFCPRTSIPLTAVTFILAPSLRSIVYNDAENTAHSNEFYESLQLTFAVDLSPEEVGFEAWKKVDFF